MINGTVIYSREDGSNRVISDIVGVMMPQLSKDTPIEVYGESYFVSTYEIVIEGVSIKAVIHVDRYGGEGA